MDRTDQQVLRQAIAWTQAGQPVALAIVAHTWGSAPRPVGAMAAVRGDGQLVGSISGGCIEDDLIERARAGRLFQRAPQRLTYGIHAEEANRFGLPCGGTVVLIVETIGAQSQLETLMSRTDAGLQTSRRLDLKTGQVTLSDAQGAAAAFSLTDDALIHVLGPLWRLLLIGAGQLSHYLAHMAVACDYSVSICDPRQEITATWAVPQTSVLRGMPDDVVVAMKPDQASAIVALTHDPKLDDLALMEALKSDAFYVGAIGSRANQAKRRERLMQFGVSAQQLARLHGPVGLSLGARTPPEIAVSIMAELTALRYGPGAHIR